MYLLLSYGLQFISLLWYFLSEAVGIGSIYFSRKATR